MVPANSSPTPTPVFICRAFTFSARYTASTLSRGVADHGRLADGRQHFHTMVDVAGHQVGTADIDLFLAAVAEIVDPAVLQKAADDAGDFDVVAHPRHAGAQAADAAHSNWMGIPACDAL